MIEARDDPACRHEVGTPGCVMDRLEIVVQGNPLVRAGRISVDYLRGERRELDPIEYGRERLGWEETAESLGRGITVAAWDALADEASRPRRLPVASNEGGFSEFSSLGRHSRSPDRSDGTPRD